MFNSYLKKKAKKNTRLLKNYNANLKIIIMTKNVIKSYMIIYVLSLQFVIKEVFLYCNYYNNTVLLDTISERLMYWLGNDDTFHN